MANDDKSTSAQTSSPPSAEVKNPEASSSTQTIQPAADSKSHETLLATTEGAVISSSPSSSQQDSRAELIERARAFLHSPQSRHEDVYAKRRFLGEKGLNESEIERLIQELPSQAPLIPPRTYPQAPPSNLPNLLIGLARIFTWLAGGSALTIFVYYRYLLPLLTHSYQARLSIKAHQKDLLSKLNTSIQSLKETQAEAYSVLPKPSPFKEEDVTYKDCHSLDQIVAAAGEKPQEIPPFSLMRCAVEDFASQKREADTDALFQAIETKLPWLKAEEAAPYLNELWQTLSKHPFFSYTDTSTTSIWTYTPPSPPEPTALVTSLSTLRSTLPTPRSQTINPFQHTLQALSDFTGYITTQIYALPTVSAYRTPGFSSGTLGPEEEELRKEIRALKGLVLNRRSFMPIIPRASSVPPIVKTTTTP